MKFIHENKKYILIIFLAVAGFWLYSTYFAGGSEELLTEQTVSPISQDILAVLSSLNTIRLDNSIFTDPVFTSLSDFGVTIPPENVGRRNPFAPL